MRRIFSKRRWHRVDIHILDEEAHRTADALAEEAEAVRDSEATALAAAFRADTRQGDAISKLSRYEAAIERALYRALRALERLRERRRDPDAAADAVFDGTVIAGAVDSE